MGRLLATTALILTVAAASGCYPCMQNSYYDPSCGVVYGPSINPPTFLSGLGKNKHDKHSCPLCTTDTSTGPFGPADCCGLSGAATGDCGHGHGGHYPAQSTYGAAFGQPVPVQDAYSPNCACPSPQNCSAGCSGGRHTPGCRGKAPSGCNCAKPVANCGVCGPCQHHLPTSSCSTCSTYGDEYSGVVYDEPIYSDSMTLPGETFHQGETFHHGDSILPETFSSGSCPNCKSKVNGPIFQGTIIPENDASKPLIPAPVPAAEPALETVPGETVIPEPDPLPATTMMIPAFPAPRPTRQVHWVPNALK